jgi:sugar lactone lactonase YvrE
MAPTLTLRGPRWFVPGGRALLDLAGPLATADGPPEVTLGDEPAHVLSIGPRHLRFVIPQLDGGMVPVRIGGVDGALSLQVAETVTTDVHQVDSPAFDGLGRLYATHSGTRESKGPASLYRVSADGQRQPIAADLGNPTSLTLGPDGALYVSSRFEGHVYRVSADDRVELYATELGVPTGLAFGPDGALYVGDRSGSILRIGSDRRIDAFAALPPSVAAYHLAFGPDGALYVTAPTLATHDPVYRISPERTVDEICDGFGRPQGIAFEASGALYVVDALAGASGVYRVDVGAATPVPELVVSGPTLVGIAFDPRGGMVLCSNETIWRLDVDLRPLEATR